LAGQRLLQPNRKRQPPYQLPQHKERSKHRRRHPPIRAGSPGPFRIGRRPRRRRSGWIRTWWPRLAISP
jgi:hypothetical protein